MRGFIDSFIDLIAQFQFNIAILTINHNCDKNVFWLVEIICRKKIFIFIFCDY